MLLLKKVIQLPKATGLDAVADNLGRAFEALGHECIILDWSDSSGTNKELCVTDNAGNTAGVTILPDARAEAIRTDNPRDIAQYIATTINNFSGGYEANLDSHWGIQISYVNILSKLDLEPAHRVLAVAQVEA